MLGQAEAQADYSIGRRRGPQVEASQNREVTLRISESPVIMLVSSETDWHGACTTHCESQGRDGGDDENAESYRFQRIAERQHFGR